MTMKDYPPSQTAGSFNLDKMQKQIEAGAAAASSAAVATHAPAVASRRAHPFWEPNS